MPFIEATGGTALFVTDWGAGRPVVLVHAWGLNSGMWDRQVPDLVDAGHRVVTFDRRGHGRSDRPGGGYDLDTLADDLACVLDHLDLDEVTIVGHSLGAAEVVRYLTRHTQRRVAQVVLSAPVTPCLRWSDQNPGGIEGALLDASCQSLRDDVGTWVEAGTAAYFGVGRAVSSLALDWTQRAIIDTPLPVLLATMASFTEADLRHELTMIDRPTLVLHGTADASAPFEVTGRPTAALLPEGRLIAFEGAGHGLYLADASAYNHELLRFVAGAT
jgi:pimeloyl-ACP methyl ester carboxylesterase